MCRCVKVQRIGANYDPITSGKMDDLVSRIINVSMDPYFYYIPITVGNENARLTNSARLRTRAARHSIALVPESAEIAIRKRATQDNGVITYLCADEFPCVAD